MANRRIYYACEQIGIKPDGNAGSFNALHGIQAVSSNTNFNLVQVFEYGQISLYQNIEEIPDVQLTVSKVIDGYPLIYHRATQTAPNPTLAGRSTEKCVVALGIFPDTNTSANGADVSEVIISGVFVGSLNYTFEVAGNGTEEVTLVGNNRVWANDPNIALGSAGLVFSGSFTGTDSPLSPVGVVRRQDIQFATVVTSGDLNGSVADPDCSVMPQDIFGITSSGINPNNGSSGNGAHIQSVKFSVDLNRTALNELGRFAPYTRYANFPVEVNTEISVISISGDMVSANEAGIYSTGTGCGSFLGNLKNRTIRLATCEGTRIYTGLKNKLSSINQTGGDTGGGNVEDVYSYRTYNDFTVMHSGDPNSNFNWSARAGYLLN